MAMGILSRFLGGKGKEVDSKPRINVSLSSPFPDFLVQAH